MSSALIFVVLCVLGVIICSGDRIMTWQVVMDRTYPWHSDFNVISASAFISCYFGGGGALVMANIGSRICCDMCKVIFTMLSVVKIYSSYAFCRYYLSLIYKNRSDYAVLCNQFSEYRSKGINVCNHFVTLVHNWKMIV